MCTVDQRNDISISFGEIVLNSSSCKDEAQDYGLISYETWQIFQVVNYVFISGPVSCLGIGGNIVNVIVFLKHGFKDSMTISFFGLAIADFLILVTTLWMSICYNPLFINADLPFDSLNIMYLSAGYPNTCFNRVTSLITAFVTLERCLCITMPLKVKTIITPARTKNIMVAIFVSVILVFAPFYFVNKLEWKFSHSLNKTILSLKFESNREEVETVIFVIQGMGLSSLSLISVIVCTLILVIKLNSKSKWRQTVTNDNVARPTKESVSMKDKKAVKMVVFISIIFIICYVPGTVNFITMAFVPDFGFGGKYETICLIVWSIAAVLHVLSSSVNILVYYNMSSKYKTTFCETFRRWRRENIA